MADDDRQSLLAEAYKRGVLPPDMKSAYEEGQKRGLVKAPEVAGKLERFETGFMDPIYGAAQVGARMPQEGIPTPEWDEYQKGLQATVDKTIREREAKYQKTAPQGTDWARMGGSMLNPLPYVPLLAGGIPGAVLSGAIAGLTEPVAGKDVGGEKTRKTVAGAAIGGVLGTVGKGIGWGVNAFGQYLAREFPENVMTQAVQTILKRINQDKAAGGPSAKDAIDLINVASLHGKPMTLADVGGKNVERLAGNVYRGGGEGAAITEKFLQTRDEGAAQRLSGDITKYVKGGDSMHKTTEALLSARSAEGKPLWEQVRGMEGVWSPRLQQFIDDRVVKAGMARGYEIERLESLAENRPFDPTQMGVDLDAEGNIKLIRTPNMRVLHMGKMGLDAMIADERNEITGRLSQRGVALERVRQAYLGEIDSLDRTGIYAKARGAWEGRSKSLDAIREGRTVFSSSPEENAAAFAKLSPADQEFYRVGVADILRERLAKTGLSGDEAKSIIKNPWVRDQLKPIFRTPAEFDAFADSVTAESRMFTRNVKIRGGSQTAEREAEDKSLGNKLVAHGSMVAAQASTGHYLWMLKSLLEAKKDLGMMANPKLNEQIAKILFQTPIDPASEVGQRLTGQFVGGAPVNRMAPLANAIGSAGALAPAATSALAGPGN